MSVGLLGATGTLDIDGLTIELVPAGGAETTNLVINGDFELGDPDPARWIVDRDVHRVISRQSIVVRGARADAGRVASTRRARGAGRSLRATRACRIAVRCAGLRGGGRRRRRILLPRRRRPAIARLWTSGDFCFAWSGTNPTGGSIETRRPRAAQARVRAVLQFEKHDAGGAIRDRRRAGDRGRPTPTPALDAIPRRRRHRRAGFRSPLRPRSPPTARSTSRSCSTAPAGKHGVVTVKDGRLGVLQGGRARFFGVSLLAPAAFLEPDRADQLADRLARSGINLVRLGDLDTPSAGPQPVRRHPRRHQGARPDRARQARSPDRRAQSAGIYVALELQSSGGSGPTTAWPTRVCSPGGGPAAIFDPTIVKLTSRPPRQLLESRQPRDRTGAPRRPGSPGSRWRARSRCSTRSTIPRLAAGLCQEPARARRRRAAGQRRPAVLGIARVASI